MSPVVQALLALSAVWLVLLGSASGIAFIAGRYQLGRQLWGAWLISAALVAMLGWAQIP